MSSTVRPASPSADDDLPEFFYTEPLEPTNKVARFRGDDIHDMYEALDA